jgi:signal recognition particle subunit SRP54
MFSIRIVWLSVSLGMGDVVSLVERAQEQFDEEEARKLQKKIAKNEFGFDDFLNADPAM